MRSPATQADTPGLAAAAMAWTREFWGPDGQDDAIVSKTTRPRGRRPKTGGDTGEDGDRGRQDAPKAALTRVYDNIALITGCETAPKMANAFMVTLSTPAKWRGDGRVPLRYCAPFLPFLTWEELAYGSVKGTINEGRGYTRDVAEACFNPTRPGPILIASQTNFSEVMRRIQLILQANDYGNIAEGFETKRSNIATWAMREKIPDSASHSFCRRHAVNLAWLLTGFGQAMAPADANETPLFSEDTRF